jgi:hypothetical protein
VEKQVQNIHLVWLVESWKELLSSPSGTGRTENIIHTLSPHKHIDGSLEEPSAKRPWELLRVEHEQSQVTGLLIECLKGYLFKLDLAHRPTCEKHHDREETSLHVVTARF